MAIAPVNKFVSIAVPVAPGLQKLYEVPTGTSALVLYAQVANVGVGTYPTVTFVQRRESRSTGLTRDIRVIKDVEIPPNDGVILIDGRMVLEKTPLIVDRVFISGTQSGVSTIVDVQYTEPTGVCTVMTEGNHGFSVGDQITMAGIAFTCSNNTSGITTTIFPDPQASYIVNTVADSKVFSTNIGKANGIIHYFNAADHRFIRSVDDAVTIVSSSDKYTPSDATYTPKDGKLKLNLVNNSLFTSATSHTPSDIDYNAHVGILTVTTATAHGFSSGNLVKFDDYALTLKCSMDGKSTNHTYPRPTDPMHNKWQSITVESTTKFKLDVGSSPISWYSASFAEYDPTVGITTLVVGSNTFRGPSKHTPTNAAYNPTTGVVTITLNNHRFNNGDWINIAKESLVMSCAFGGASGDAAKKAYPRLTDPAYGKWIPISNVTTNTFDVQVLNTTPSTNTDAHTFVSWADNAISRATSTVKIGKESLRFTCAKDAHATNHDYPRTSDPYYNTSIPVVARTDTTVSLGIGTADVSDVGIHTFVSPTKQKPTAATYNASTGAMTVTIANHGFELGDAIKIDNNSMTFECTYGGGGEDSYPRATDPAADTWLPISNVTTNTFDVNVGGAGAAASNAHTFKIATAGISRSVVRAGGDYDHDFVSAVTNGMKRATESITIANSSLIFSCSQDGFGSEHAYPRPSDPASGTNLGIIEADPNSITVNVGISTAGGLVAPLQMEFLASILENSNA
tara:strand:- start:2111 stop:4327 length:2217 start_codon:yes stop_codon:yes gene_type:complete